MSTPESPRGGDLSTPESPPPTPADPAPADPTPDSMWGRPPGPPVDPSPGAGFAAPDAGYAPAPPAADPYQPPVAGPYPTPAYPPAAYPPLGNQAPDYQAMVNPATGYPVTAVPAQPAYGAYGGYGYSPPAYPYGVAYAPAPRTNPLAIASMVVSICSVVFLICYGLGALIGAVGAILGHVARRQLRERSEGGAGMALAGIIVGWIATVLGLVFLVVVVIAFTQALNDFQ